jgi:hypothetical protein
MRRWNAAKRPRRAIVRSIAAFVSFPLITLFVLLSILGSQASAEVIPIVFPLEKRVSVGHGFFTPRSGHLHQGIDLFAAKMTKLVAVVDGTVTLQVREYQGQPWYTLWLSGDDGRGYYYSHINNDTPGTDDGRGGIEHAFAPGLVTGMRVTQGQVLAYCGDSGNAEGTSPHLHFQIHPTTALSSVAMDPYDSLFRAPLAGGAPAPSWPARWLIRYEQTDSRVAYMGVWKALAATGTSGGSYIYADSKAEALVWFEGTRLDLVSTKGTTLGIAEVSIDGGPAQKIDLYSPSTLRQQIVWSSGTLSDGTHSVAVRWTGERSAPTGGTRVAIDRLNVTGRLVQTPLLTTHQETSSLLSYSGSWTRLLTGSASGGSLRYASAAGPSVSVEFNGIHVTWLATTGPSYGIARLTLDDGEPILVDLYSATTSYRQKVWNSGTIENGRHVLTIEPTGLKNPAATATRVAFDAVQTVGGLVKVGSSPWEGPMAGTAIFEE